MSRSTQLQRDLTTGIHLLTVLDAKPIENGVQIRFSDGFNNLYDKQFSFEEDKISEFLKFCVAIKVDPNKPKFKSNVVGTRFWGLVKEVHDINLDQPVLHEGKPVINYYLFDYRIIDNIDKKPIVKGCPDDKTPAGGVFLDYRQVEVEVKPNLPKEEIIAQAKNMIKKIEQKVVEPKEEPKDPWEDF